MIQKKLMTVKGSLFQINIGVSVIGQAYNLSKNNNGVIELQLTFS